MSGFDLRPVGPDDLETICRHRHVMFKVSGRTDDIVAPMTEHFRPWIKPWLDDGRVIGGVGMMVIDWPPHPSHPTQSSRGYVLNMYVEPELRRIGLGRQLMELCHQEAERRGLDYLVLQATNRDGGSTKSSAGPPRLRWL